MLSLPQAFDPKEITKIYCEKKPATKNTERLIKNACRKTILVKMMKDGNSLDNVSKFIGHANMAITPEHYWLTTPSDLAANMNISWLVTANNFATAENESQNNTTKIQNLLAITVEGFKAQERFSHAFSMLTLEQIEKLNEMWNENNDENVLNKTEKWSAEMKDLFEKK